VQKIRIRLPATLTNIGPGLNSLGLAVGLYVTVEISQRADASLDLTYEGEGAGSYPTTLHHPVILGMARFFQRIERAPSGLTIRVQNDIPLASGLGAEAAFMVAGVLAANDIMAFPYRRDEAYSIAAQFSRADHAITALSGGLTASLLDEDTLHYRQLDIAPMQIVIALPRLDRYQRVPMPEQITTRSALDALSRQPLLLSALRYGDHALLARVIEEPIHLPRMASGISGYQAVANAARAAGASAITISGSGPAMVAFADDDHDRIADVMRLAFAGAGVEARTWVLPVDTQGVVISAMRSV
jgi:homoserine kinase